VVACLLSCTEPAEVSPPDHVPLSETSPDPVILAAGDIAGCAHEGDLLTAAYINSVPDATVLTLGDNAYQSGSAAEYANCYEPGWGQFKSRTRPALGNHEYNGGNATPSFDYFGAAAWGNSRPNGYYSFDLGEWHIVVLNDNTAYVAISASSAQAKWLQADLSATRKTCILAVWHQPMFYSKYGGQPGYVASRKRLWSILYSARADLILNGHWHVYERYAAQDPDGRPTLDGIRQFIVGTGGFDTYDTPTVLSPNVEVVHGGDQDFGVLKLTLQPSVYAWEFVPVGDNTFTDQGAAGCHTESGASAAASVTTLPAEVAGKVTIITVKTRDASGLAQLTGGDAVVVQVSGANSAAPLVTDNANGSYTARYTPIAPGANTVTVTLNGTPLNGSPYSSVVSPKIIKVGSSRLTQTGMAPGSIVPYPPSAKVTDGAGVPLPGVTVTFTVLAGGGSVSPTSRVTNAKGIATLDRWTVGPVAGTNQVRAAVSAASFVDFLAISQ
jgi:filamin/ABP280 repeat protein/calcineurin-like phosphoesterase family protein